jgi:hypothetical protein
MERHEYQKKGTRIWDYIESVREGRGFEICYTTCPGWPFTTLAALRRRGPRAGVASLQAFTSKLKRSQVA